jgi:hypothetical protein
MRTKNETICPGSVFWHGRWRAFKNVGPRPHEEAVLTVFEGRHGLKTHWAIPAWIVPRGLIDKGLAARMRRQAAREKAAREKTAREKAAREKAAREKAAPAEHPLCDAAFLDIIREFRAPCTVDSARERRAEDRVARALAAAEHDEALQAEVYFHAALANLETYVFET